jgi:hypothetical protein
MRFGIVLHLIIVLFLILSPGCGRRVRSDTSQKPGEAIAKGLPDMSKEWSYRDYQQFYQYVSKLPRSIMLPHFSSEKSSAIMMKYEAHIIRPVLTDRSVDLNLRLQIVIEMQMATKETLKVYINRHFSGEDYSTEMAVLMGINFAIGAQLMDRLDEFLPTLDPSSPTYSTRMEGLKQVKYGIATMFQAWVVALGETKNYTKDELIRMSRYVEKHGPPLTRKLDQDQQDRIKTDLNRISSQSPIPEIRKIASDLLSSSFKGNNPFMKK